MTSLFLPTESKHKKARETMLRYNEAIIKSSQARQAVFSDKDFNERRKQMLKDMKDARMKDKQFANSEQVMEYAMADFEFLTGKRSFQERIA